MQLVCVAGGQKEKGHFCKMPALKKPNLIAGGFLDRLAASSDSEGFLTANLNG